jgi:hypothetical protein
MGSKGSASRNRVRVLPIAGSSLNQERPSSTTRMIGAGTGISGNSLSGSDVPMPLDRIGDGRN